MNITELKDILEENPTKSLDFILPDKTSIPLRGNPPFKLFLHSASLGG